jgi:hypothetical protein
MPPIPLKRALVPLFAFCFLLGQAQSSTKKKTIAPLPESFTISASQVQEMLKLKEGESVAIPENKYLDKSKVVKNAATGDMKFLRLRLNYFKNAHLNVQVNGEYSTQYFLLSDRKTFFYKGHTERDVVTMKKCRQDDIYQE